jgi:hypothetical protein
MEEIKGIKRDHEMTNTSTTMVGATKDRRTRATVARPPPTPPSDDEANARENRGETRVVACRGESPLEIRRVLRFSTASAPLLRRELRSASLRRRALKRCGEVEKVERMVTCRRIE